MKKEPLSIMTVKTLLAVIIFTGLGTIIIGGAYLIGKQGIISLPHYQPSDKSECEIDSDCELVYTGHSPCLPCDTSREDYKCFTQEEIEKMGERKIFNNVVACKPCQESQHTCVCSNGKCEKVKKEEVEEVTIITDKTEYEQGENVKITVKNNLEEEICYPIYSGSSCWKLPFGVEKFSSIENKWTDIPIGKHIAGELIPCLQHMSMPSSKCSKGSINFLWDQNQKSKGIVSSGKYRIVFPNFIYKKQELIETKDFSFCYSF